MQLIHARPSPFVRKVMVLLHEAGRTDEVTLVSEQVTPLDRTNAATSFNPLGKIPALVRDDGPAIYDSRVICRYLDTRFGAGLYPEARIWETLTLEATADGIMDAAVLMVYEARVRPDDKQSPDWIEAQWTKVARALDALSSRWISHLSGRPDMGQIAVACALGYLDFRHSGRDWRKGHDALAAWHGRFAERPSMQATAP